MFRLVSLGENVSLPQNTFLVVGAEPELERSLALPREENQYGRMFDRLRIGCVNGDGSVVAPLVVSTTVTGHRETADAIGEDFGVNYFTSPVLHAASKLPWGVESLDDVLSETLVGLELETVEGVVFVVGKSLVDFVQHGRQTNSSPTFHVHRYGVGGIPWDGRTEARIFMDRAEEARLLIQRSLG